MKSTNHISRFLDQLYLDWLSSRDDFPKNVYPCSQWPIPFFGNPATALVATIGVNPSSTEFAPERSWDAVKTKTDWKCRLRDYFVHKIPPHEWFEPWRAGLAVLGMSYENGSAVHFDLSYRATIAMLKNRRTDLNEFRQMVDYDVDHLFTLLHLCPHLRMLLIFGPIPPAKSGRPGSLCGHFLSLAAIRGFQITREHDSWRLWHEPSQRSFVVHEADTQGEKCITRRVVKNLSKHREALLLRIGTTLQGPTT